MRIQKGHVARLASSSLLEIQGSVFTSSLIIPLKGRIRSSIHLVSFHHLLRNTLCLYFGLWHHTYHRETAQLRLRSVRGIRFHRTRPPSLISTSRTPCPYLHLEFLRTVGDFKRAELHTLSRVTSVYTRGSVAGSRCVQCFQPGRLQLSVKKKKNLKNSKIMLSLPCDSSSIVLPHENN